LTENLFSAVLERHLSIVRQERQLVNFKKQKLKRSREWSASEEPKTKRFLHVIREVVNAYFNL